MTRRAVLLLGLLLPLLLVTGAPASGDTRPISGSWQITFTPSSVQTVGKSLRGTNFTCPTSCETTYQFNTPGAGDGRTTQLQLLLDSSGCNAAPCDLRAIPDPSGYGFTAPIQFDGTTYSGTGEGMFRASVNPGCQGKAPTGTDHIRFTVAGGGGTPQLSGDLTVVLTLSFADQPCKLIGYEVYKGTITGVPLASAGGAINPGATAPGAGKAASTARALTPLQLKDRAAAATHERPVLSTHVATARDLPWSPKRLLFSALIAMLLVALLPFPAALFNATLHANYAEVRGWVSFLPTRRAGAESSTPGWRGFAALALITGLLNALLDPKLGFDRASAVLVTGLVLSVAVVSVMASLPNRWHARRSDERVVLRLYPLGLAVAAISVLVSRLTSFQPGYLYGLVAGFALAHALARRDKGRMEFKTSAFLLAVALLAFVLRIPVHDATVDSGGIPLALLDTVLAAVFAAGVEANLLGLLPLRFLPGDEVMSWSKRWWALAFGLNAFVFVHALTARAGDDSARTSLAVAAALFLGFGAVSVAFWSWFRFRSGTPEEFPSAVAPVD